MTTTTERTRRLLHIIARTHSQPEINSARNMIDNFYHKQYIPTCICNAINARQDQLDNPRHND